MTKTFSARCNNTSLISIRHCQNFVDSIEETQRPAFIVTLIESVFNSVECYDGNLLHAIRSITEKCPLHNNMAWYDKLHSQCQSLLYEHKKIQETNVNTLESLDHVPNNKNDDDYYDRLDIDDKYTPVEDDFQDDSDFFLVTKKKKSKSKNLHEAFGGGKNDFTSNHTRGKNANVTSKVVKNTSQDIRKTRVKK